jgi:hypothetical protein
MIEDPKKYESGLNAVSGYLLLHSVTIGINGRIIVPLLRISFTAASRLRGIGTIGLCPPRSPLHEKDYLMEGKTIAEVIDIDALVALPVDKWLLLLVKYNEETQSVRPLIGNKGKILLYAVNHHMAVATSTSKPLPVAGK